MSVEDTVRSFKEIVEGKHDDLPERAFYMKGGIDEVTETMRSETRTQREEAEEAEENGGS